jgi:hypothetical protein
MPILNPLPLPISPPCPNPCRIVDHDLVTVAVNDAWCRARTTKRQDIVGRGVFDVFPDDPGTTGTGTLHASLMRGLDYGRPDAMAIQKYDICKPACEGGAFEVQYWSPAGARRLGRGEPSVTSRM